jgi:hypothetical protein
MGGRYPKEIWYKGIVTYKFESTQAIALPGAIDSITTLQEVAAKWGIVTSGTAGMAFIPPH